MLALLASRPLRRRNLTMIELGRHLVRDGAGWLLLFAADETKTGQPIELPWPKRLNAPLEYHLDRYRPILLAGRIDSRLWIGRWAHPIGEGGVYERIARVTRKLFGQALGPHLFRDCFATSIAIHDPEHIGVAATLLGHSEHVNRRHYNHARMLQAGRLYHRGLLDLRRQLAPVPPGKRRAGSR